MPKKWNFRADDQIKNLKIKALITKIYNSKEDLSQHAAIKRR